MTHHGLVGECLECGGRMVEHWVTHGSDGVGRIGLRCEDCDGEGRVKYQIGEENPWKDPSVCEGVADMRVAEIRWHDCQRCNGFGWIEDPICDLRRAMNGREHPCPVCHTSGSTPVVVS